MAESEDRRLPSPRPGDATADHGVVFLEGPRGVVAALTPEAAEATGRNLQQAASLAARQRGEAARAPIRLGRRDKG
jgi:hypothetical protein